MEKIGEQSEPNILRSPIFSAEKLLFPQPCFFFVLEVSWGYVSFKWMYRKTIEVKSEVQFCVHGVEALELFSYVVDVLSSCILATHVNLL